MQDCILAPRPRTWYDSGDRGPLAQWQSTSLITTWFQVRILGGPPAVHLLSVLRVFAPLCEQLLRLNQHISVAILILEQRLDHAPWLRRRRLAECDAAVA